MSATEMDALRALVLFLADLAEDDLRSSIVGCVRTVASYTAATEELNGREQVDKWRSNAKARAAYDVERLTKLAALTARLPV